MMFLAMLFLFCGPAPELNAVPPEAVSNGKAVWQDYPWRPTRFWRGPYGFLWCDDPTCPVCSANIYGWRDVPIRRK